MKEKIKNRFRQIYRNILKILPAKIVFNIENLRGYHKFLNLKNPKYFGEKIQWLKLNGNLEKYTDLVDKYKVREYIKEKIGEEYLIPLIGVYDNSKDINYNILPNRFVLKLNTGSGYNIICKNKDEFNYSQANKQLEAWMREDYYKIKKEIQYKNIKKKIICEEFLSDKNNKLLDYKFYCFEGKVEFVEVDFNRFENHTMNFYDRDWNLLKLSKGKYKNYFEEVEKPNKLNEMILLAEKISQDLLFSRIDLYYVNDKIYFGEITLTPASGLTAFKPIEKDLEYAKLILLEKRD